MISMLSDFKVKSFKTKSFNVKPFKVKSTAFLPPAL